MQGDKISMWLCEAKPQEAIVKIGQTLKKRLGIDDKVVRFSPLCCNKLAKLGDAIASHLKL